MDIFEQLQLRPIYTPWAHILQETLKNVGHQLFIISPYIKREVIHFCEDALRHRTNSNQSINIKVLTRTLPEEFMSGSSDITALLDLFDWKQSFRANSVEIRSINNLHAKVWIFDDNVAIIGSGNATPSGLEKNLEYGLKISNSELVTAILNDWHSWWEHGTQISKDNLSLMYAWMKSTANNTALLQFDQEANKKRSELLQELEPVPSLGNKIYFSNGTENLFVSSDRIINESFQGKDLPYTKNNLEKNKIENNEQKDFLKFSAEDSYLPVTIENHNIDSNFDPTQIEEDEEEILKLEDLVDLKDTMWKFLSNKINDPMLIGHSLRHHCEVEIIGNGTILPSSKSALEASEHWKNVDVVDSISEECIKISYPEFWHAVISTFPLVEKLRNIVDSYASHSGKLTLDFTCKQKKGKCIGIKWEDSYRKSQWFVKYNGQSKAWKIVLDTKASISLINKLNLSFTNRLFTTKNDSYFHFLFDTSSSQIEVYYPADPFFFMGRSLDPVRKFVKETIQGYPFQLSHTQKKENQPLDWVKFENQTLQDALMKGFTFAKDNQIPERCLDLYITLGNVPTLYISSTLNDNGILAEINCADANIHSSSFDYIVISYPQFSNLIFHTLYKDLDAWSIFIDDINNEILFIPNDIHKILVNWPYHKLCYVPV